MQTDATDSKLSLNIEVAYALPEQQWVVTVPLATGATVADALAAVAQRDPFAELALETMAVGIYGEVVQPNHKLQDFDRVEVYRPLHQDPKAARRMRAEQSRQKSRQQAQQQAQQ